MALSEGGLGLAGWVLLVVLALNLVLANVLEPRLVGNPMRLHPVAVLLATVAGGVIAGLFGLVFAAPAVAITANVVRELRLAGFFDGRAAEASGAGGAGDGPPV
jgi:predicted PurR-regulated permease PerM